MKTWRQFGSEIWEYVICDTVRTIWNVTWLILGLVAKFVARHGKNVIGALCEWLVVGWFCIEEAVARLFGRKPSGWR